MSRLISCMAGLTLAAVLLSGCDQGRMMETPGVKPHEAPLLVMPSGVVPFGGGDALARSTVPADMKPAVDLASETTLAAGKTAYFTYCVHCHGRNYDGAGTVGQSFAPLPTSMNSDAVRKLSDGELYRVISFGKPGGRHPGLATTMSEEDRWAVAAFVKSVGNEK